MDIGSLFNHEILFPLHLKHPVTDQPLGIVFNIRSSTSDEVKRVGRKHLDERTERSQRGKLVKGDTLVRYEVEKAAAAIASWDWGENQYKGEIPELSLKKAADILDAEDWIFDQVKEAANNLANFTTSSVED